MTKQEHLYVKLMEECAEVQQRAAKLMQFGSEEKEPGQDLTNAQRLRNELNDLLTIVDMLECAGLPQNSAKQEADHIANKYLKVEKYLKYSQELGCVNKR